MSQVLDVEAVAQELRRELRAEVDCLPGRLRLVGVLATDDAPSRTYARYTAKAFRDMGAEFEVLRTDPDHVADAIRELNGDPEVHGAMVYYPIHGGGADDALRQVLDPGKDIEGLHRFWSQKLYANERFADDAHTKPAILPCTPLAMLKIVESSPCGGQPPLPLAGKGACIFNRSEVVGRPLAAMMANDGARVVSFDLDGPMLFVNDGQGGHRVEPTVVSRAEALAHADIVVSGVPSKRFERIGAAELKPASLCINFASVQNFGDDVKDADVVFVPRIGPMTVTVALRNSIRLYRNAHLLA